MILRALRNDSNTVVQQNRNRIFSPYHVENASHAWLIPQQIRSQVRAKGPCQCVAKTKQGAAR